MSAFEKGGRGLCGQLREVLKATGSSPRKETLQSNQERPGAGRRITHVIGAQAGDRVLEEVMEPG